jgi:hypothetical protein
MKRGRSWKREREEARRQKAGPRLHPSGNAAFYKCRLHAERRGLFLLAEARRPQPLRWTLFDSKTGVELPVWFPVTGRWRAGGDSGVCQWPEALPMATSRRDAMTQARAAG